MPNWNTDTPIYLQIAHMIETDILHGLLPEESQVPSTNELSDLYTINPATAAKALNLLVDAGYLYKKRGVGMFVAKGAHAKLLHTKRAEFLQIHLPRCVAHAQALGISTQQLIEQLQGGNPDDPT